MADLYEWMKATSDEIAKSYEDYRSIVRQSARIQEVGHATEAAWVDTLRKWLPPQYEFGTRKYILPEVDVDDYVYRETDIVIYRPGYPRALIGKHEVLAAGVLAAFSVKRTLDREGLREAAIEAANVRRHTAIRYGSPRRELTLPFRYGVLAHSHRFGVEPRAAVGSKLIEFDNEFAHHPRESLDLVCVADLGVWSKSTSTYHNLWDHAAGQQSGVWGASTAFMDHTTSKSADHRSLYGASMQPNDLEPVVVFLGSLYGMLADEDAFAEPFYQGLVSSGLSGSGVGSGRFWPPEIAYSEGIRDWMPRRFVNGFDPEWSMHY